MVTIIQQLSSKTVAIIRSTMIVLGGSLNLLVHIYKLQVSALSNHQANQSRRFIRHAGQQQAAPRRRHPFPPRPGLRRPSPLPLVLPGRRRRCCSCRHRVAPPLPRGRGGAGARRHAGAGAGPGLHLLQHAEQGRAVVWRRRLRRQAGSVLHLQAYCTYQNRCRM